MSANIIYLDYNCFQRCFDDPTQARIRLETLACEEIFAFAETGEVRLVWSFMHQDETILCPFPERKYEVMRIATICKIRIGPKDDILSLALSFQKRSGLSSKDAIHLSCAYSAKANFFLTCDDKLLRQAKPLKLELSIMNPVDYFRQEVMRNEQPAQNGGF